MTLYPGEHFYPPPGRNVYIAAFGEVVIPEPVRQACYMRAVRKHRGDILKINDYAYELLTRWASATAYYLWRNP